MKKIFISIVYACIISPLYSMQNDQQIEITQEPVNKYNEKSKVLHCMQYYCCDPQQCAINDMPEKTVKAGKCLFVTGFTAKIVEFSLFSCCYPDSPVSNTCKALWFPSCNNYCSGVLNCCGATIDTGCTIATFTGPLLWIGGLIWEKHKNREKIIAQSNNDIL